MTVWNPNRARPHWGAHSECTRCGQPITWRGKWLNNSANEFCASSYARHHHSATAGTPPANSHESTELAEREARP